MVEVGFELLSELQREHGFTVVVAILPAFSHRFSNYQEHRVHEKLRAAAEPYPNLEILDLLPLFREESDDAAQFAFDGLHLNERGHRVLTKLLTPVVREIAERR